MANKASRKVQVGTPNDGFQAIYPGVSQKKAFNGTSAQSTAVGISTSIVRLVATEDCHLAFGTNPTAVADGTCMFLPADTECYIGIQPSHKIAVIQDSAGGDLFITEGKG